MRRSVGAALFVMVFLFACDGGHGGEDGGTPDAGPRDASSPPADSGPGRDAGPRLDAGPMPACSIPAAFDVGASYETTLTVAPGGDDGNDGSDAAPLATIRAAADRATPGTRIVVRAGTYPAVGLGTVQGTADRPIAFVAEGAVTIDASSGVGWAMSDAQYVVIEGFTIENAMVHGMNLDDGGSYDTPAHHLVLRSMVVRDAGSGGNNDCIKMSGVDDFWVLDSEVSGCNRGEIIDMVGCHRGVIHGNYFHDPVGSGLQTKGGSSDTLIHGNLFADIPGRGVNAGGSTGLEFFRPLDAPHEAARIRVVANLFERVGADSGAPIAYVGCDGCEAVNNTIVDPRTWIVRILQESTDARFVPSRNGVFINNLIVFDTAAIRTYVNVGGGTAPETFTFGNNLWFARDDSGFTGPSLPSEIPAPTGDVIQRDPAFAGASDYHVAAGSPADGAGRGETLPPDYDGRCYATPPTIGAYEVP